jgi:NAD(P)-dependent dehydrogenase (short-subunit alcohol dehydrogenase family)
MTEPEGRVALVTGASRGIGRSIALALADAGLDDAAVARSEADLAALGEEVRGRGVEFLAVPGDLGDPTFPTAAGAAAVGWQGRLDVLVNGAGTIVRRDPPDVTAEDIDLVLGLNVRAPLLLSQAVHPALAASGDGSIVNVASLAASTVTRASVTYQASKAALVQMTRALAVRWGPDVRVNAVGPGYVETDLNREWLADPAHRGYVERSTALGRVGAPADVAGVVVFLASPAAAYMTGQHLVIDGGWHTP